MVISAHFTRLMIALWFPVISQAETAAIDGLVSL